jgi:hypothetical protein
MSHAGPAAYRGDVTSNIMGGHRVADRPLEEQ